ncbi:uncharacterized protein LOC135373096 [Ornithodoros turicata]|uniref:uncharacterized protein LOC135373096 n=1 Tax=Ornithodoros turicata TaxID=34597 RepID=UPI003138F193
MPSHNNCCIVGCNATYANSPSIRLYSFPWKTYEKDRRATWIQLVRRETSTGKLWEPTKHSRICSKHFVGNVKSDEERHPAYNPSIFPDVYRKRSTPSSDRYARAKRRRECGAVSTQSLEPTGEDEGGDHNEFSASTMTEESSGSSNISAFYCDHYDTSVAVQVSSVSMVDNGISCPQRQYETKSTGTAYKEPYFGGYKSIADNEQRLIDLTGVTLMVLSLLQSLLPDSGRQPRELHVNDKLLLFLIKLKHGVPFSCLASLFGIHRTTAAKAFKHVLFHVCAATKSWLYWPSKAAVQATMPPSFRLLYPNCRIIIDCTELKAETPAGVQAQNLWYSHYKGTYTMKYLIGIAPNGLVTFLSPGFGGRASDTNITVEAGLLPRLEPGDLVLADKGFPGIRTGVGQQKATLVMPPFATKPQFTEAEVDATYETASVRIHVERVIQRLRIFDILNRRIPHDLAEHMDKIMHVICVITNVKPGIFRKNDETMQF